VISRRALLGTGVGAIAVAGAVAVGKATHRIDDVANSIGIKPRPRPVGSDDTLIASVAKNQDHILTAIEATAAHHFDLADKLAPFAKIAQSHLTAVGGSSTVPTAEPVDPDPVVAVKALAQTLSTASTARAKDAGRAVSPDLARVLSSMSAGLAQSARTLGALV
jgi:hypothetical protein